MTRNTLCGLALLAAISLSAGAVFAADPSLHEVYRAAASGQLKQAEAMMDQVLRDHPNSGKAHFVEAEILAKDGQLGRARAEFANAERLAPGLPFAKPEAVDSLRARLNPPARITTAPTAAAAPAAPASQFPWGLALMGAGLLAAIVFFVRSFNRPTVISAGGNYVPAGGGYGPGGYPQPVGGMGPMAPTGGMGSGILGGLATGAAVGAGMVAGEALMHRVFDGGHGGDTGHLQPPVDYPVTQDAGYDMGGDDFGVADAGSWDDAGGGGGDDWN